MKISGIKVGFNVDVGEFDIDLKDVVDIMRLEHEHSRELRKECKECSTERRINELQKAGPSASTKEFVEAIVNRAVQSIKDQIVNQLTSKKPKGKGEVNPDDRIADE